MIRRTDKADKELIHLIDVLDAIERLTINIEVPPLGGHRYVVERLLPQPDGFRCRHIQSQ